jgi:DNA-binding transcriptional ArsR family regulator
MEALVQGSLSSGEIAGLFHISAPAVSQHLKTLREAGLVQVRIEAQWRIYELNRAGVDQLVEWVDGLTVPEMS